MIYEIVIALLLILMLTHGCCVRRILRGELCSMCLNCMCSKCPICGLKKTGPNCKVIDPEKECKCPACKQYACQLREAFEDAKSNGKPVTVINVPTGVVSKPSIIADSSAEAAPRAVVVKIPPPPPCKCPECPKSEYGIPPPTDFPIYQPLPYNDRY